MVEVWPVIHTNNMDQVLRCAEIAAKTGCAGTLLISMHGDDGSLDRFAPRVAAEFPSLKIGVNYLTLTAPYALIRSQRFGYDATWTDRQEFSRGELSRDARAVLDVIRPGHRFFAAVAFKGQIPDPSPGDSAAIAARHGLIPTTSGPGTGIAPEVEKVRRMRAQMHPSDPLAVASGITPENVSEFASHLTHILVATGISSSFHEFDPEKLARLVGSVAP